MNETKKVDYTPVWNGVERWEERWPVHQEDKERDGKSKEEARVANGDTVVNCQHQEDAA